MPEIDWKAVKAIRPGEPVVIRQADVEFVTIPAGKPGQEAQIVPLNRENRRRRFGQRNGGWRWNALLEKAFAPTHVEQRAAEHERLQLRKRNELDAVIAENIASHLADKGGIRHGRP